MKSIEKTLERKLKTAVEKLGGYCWKLVFFSQSGFPDRTILLPGGRILFAELKDEGRQLRPQQKIVKGWLEGLGFPYHLIDTEEKLKNLIDAL